jgi:hypothetical protein
MNKKLIILFILLFAAVVHADVDQKDGVALEDMSKVDGQTVASGSNLCASGTYEIAYTGDGGHTGTKDADIICYESGTNSEQATANTADSVTSSYVEYNAADEYLQFTFDGDVNAGLGNTGFVCGSSYIVTDVAAEVLLESYLNSTNYIYVYIKSSDDKIYGEHRGNSTLAAAKGSVISADGWYRWCYTWETGADAGGKHNISIEAGDDAMDSWEENEDVEDLDDWSSDPTNFVIGEKDSGYTVTNTTRTKDVYWGTTYEGSDPLP